MHVLPRRAAWSLVSSLLLVGAVACGSSSDVTGSGGNNAPSNVTVVAGNGQTGLVGTALGTPLSVKVTTSSGTALQGATVTFAVTAGAATVTPASTTTDTAGIARASVVLGSSVGNVTINATVAGTGLTATFIVTAGTTTATTACSTGTPQAVVAGGVVPLASSTGVCLTGGTTGAEYALVVFHGNPDSTAVASLTVRSSGGATPVSTANIVPSFNAAPTQAGLTFARATRNTMQAGFDNHLRATAQRMLAPRVLAARSMMASRSPSFVTVPANPTVGTLVTMNANGGFNDSDVCDVPINITARVAAVGTSNIVLADTANPKPTFSDAEYAAFATEFDTLINPLDVQNFGQPTDIDKNGKILILFTKEVNKLTPRGSNGVIDGFFFERDLFPVAGNNTIGLGACTTSNQAEMFYVLAPDSLHVYSDARLKTDVLTQTPGTLAHEYQHLINAGRRMYVNAFQGDFEDVWLNEGLSHIAEELLFYKRSGKSPRQNISDSSFTTDAAADAFNDEQIANTDRFQIFLGKPNATSVYAGNDSLETRGATWNLLRYLADHRTGTTSDADTWQQLVNTELHGQGNIAHLFGADYMTMIRSWATTIFSDDVAGVTDARYLEPSWNYRSIFPHICAGTNCVTGYPLKVVPLSDNAPAGVSVLGGGAAYLRFTVPAGSTASIDWTSGGLPVSGLVQFTVVRSK